MESTTERMDPITSTTTSIITNEQSQLPVVIMQRQTRKRKKPKTKKIEQEEEVIVPVNIDQNDSSYHLDGTIIDGSIGSNDKSNSKQDDNMNTIATTIIKKKLRRVDFDAEDDEDFYIHHENNKLHKHGMIDIGTSIISRPSMLRLTDKGGYIHTKQSRMKISQANQGKLPWNKGMERTDTAKAKISASVRARNHIILLQKLKVLNITEEEWYHKKRQLKVARERLRKAKVLAQQYEEQRITKLNQFKRSNTSSNDDDIDDNSNKDNIHNVDESNRNEYQQIRQPQNNSTTPVGSSSSIADPIQQQQQPNQALSNNQALFETSNSIFNHDVQFTPHVFDNRDVSYNILCPHNGPGGLICCHSCMVQYTKYTSSTINDIEQQLLHKVGNEVTELVQYFHTTKHQLQQSMKVARRKPIPIRRMKSNHQSTTNKKQSQQSVLSTPNDVFMVPQPSNTVHLSRNIDQPVEENITKDDEHSMNDSSPKYDASFINIPDDVELHEI